MRNASEAICDAMLDAIKSGDAAGPATLLSLIEGIENLIAALSDHDKSNELFDAFYQDFDVVKLAGECRFHIFWDRDFSKSRTVLGEGFGSAVRAWFVPTTGRGEGNGKTEAIAAYVKSIMLCPGLRDDSRQKLIAQARELRTTPKLRCRSSGRGNTDATLWTASQGIPD